MSKVQSKSPFNGEVRHRFDTLTDEEVKIKMDRAANAFQINRKRTYEERQSFVKKLAEVIEGRADEIAEYISFQMGKPITQAEGQVKKVVAFCNYYGSEFKEPQPRELKTTTDKKGAYQKYLPTGTVYLIVPFNFPFLSIFKSALPNLLLGNVVLSKSSSTCPMVGKLTEECFMAAGLSNGEYQNVLTNYKQLDLILQTPSITGVNFTGSTNAGAKIAETAGKYVKKAVLELGGNDPFVVLQDADINLAIESAVKFRCLNAGQICTAPKRFIIDKTLYEKFKEGLIEGIKKQKHGDPLSKQTEIGPLANEGLLETIHKQMKRLPASYKVICQREDMKKPFFPITVVQCGKQEWDQELFGPVYLLFKADNYEEALQIANFGHYGLGSSVFCVKRGDQFAAEVRSGICFINSCPRSGYDYPYGGVGRSGYGRQCQKEGYLQFANLKTFLSF